MYAVDEVSTLGDGNVYNVESVSEKLVAQYDNIDYASIAQHLDAQELFSYAKSLKQSMSEMEIEQELKIETVKRGIELGIVTVESNGEIEINEIEKTIQPYSYGDLPYVTNMLGTNEKAVFNESLVKGYGVLGAASYAMNIYQKYYDSWYKYEDDNADAFRHGVWMAYAAWNSGSTYARKFGVAHEDDNQGTALARKMDLYNNDEGISIATSQVPGNVPEDDVAGIIAHLVNTGVKNGDFRRFKGKSIGVRTYLSKTSEEGAKY